MRRWMPYCVFDVAWLAEEQAFYAECAAWPGNWALGTTPEAAIDALKDVENGRAELVGVYRSCGCLFCDFGDRHPGVLSELTHRRTTRQIRFRARMSSRFGEQR